MPADHGLPYTVIASEAKHSSLLRISAILDRFRRRPSGYGGQVVAVAPRDDTFPHPRGAFRVRALRDEALRNERAQGRPGVGLAHGPPAEKSRRQSPQVWPKLPAFPARWIYGLLRALPGDRLSCPRIRDDAWHHRVRDNARALRGASAPGCQDHTAWPSARRSFVGIEGCCDRMRPTAPRLTYRDDRAYAPSTRRDGAS